MQFSSQSSWKNLITETVLLLLSAPSSCSIPTTEVIATINSHLLLLLAMYLDLWSLNKQAILKLQEDASILVYCEASDPRVK